MARASSVTIELNRAGVGALLASSEVQKVLDDKADRVKAAVESRGITVSLAKGEDGPIPVRRVSGGNATRARSFVELDHPAGLRVEAKYRVLVGSLGAAR